MNEGFRCRRHPLSVTKEGVDTPHTDPVGVFYSDHSKQNRKPLRGCGVLAGRSEVYGWGDPYGVGERTLPMGDLEPLDPKHAKNTVP